MVEKKGRPEGKPVGIFDIVFCFIAAFIFLVAGLSGAKDIQWMHDNGVSSIGAVTDAYSPNRFQTNYVVQFKTTEGVDVTAEPFNIGPVKVGDEINLLYDPRNPHNVMLATAEPSFFPWIVVLIFTIMGSFGLTSRTLNVKW